MAEITTYCYQKMRENFNTIAQSISLKNSAGVQKLRIAVTDPKVTHVFNNTEQTLTYVIVLKGTDVSLPCELAKAEFYETNVSTNALLSETFTTFTLEAAADQITITISVQIPQVL